jgi:peptidoglycan/LPS O-acetylase OafA/YrhL
LFDALRGIGALGVVVAHCAIAIGLATSGLTGALFRELQTLVAIFFVVSGFLLYRPFVAERFGGRPPPKPRAYFRRRILRIIPGYWLALTVLALYPGLDGVFGSNWWIYYGFGQIYSRHTIFSGDVPAWSLCTEVAFYALLPLYAFAMRRWPARDTQAVVGHEVLGLGVLSAASILFRVRTGSSVYLPFTLPATFLWFAMGMVLAVVSCAVEAHERESAAVRLVSKWPSLCWLGAIASLLITAYLDEHGWSLTGRYLTYGLASVLFVLPAVFGDNRTGVPRRILASPLFAWLGLISYGIYLIHWRLVWFFKEHHADALLPSGLLSMTLVVLAVTIPAAALSYYIVERPANDLKDRRRRRAEKRAIQTARPAPSLRPTR